MTDNTHILFLGYSYCASYIYDLISRQTDSENRQIQFSASYKSDEKKALLDKLEVTAIYYEQKTSLQYLYDFITSCNNISHIIISIPPAADGDIFCHLLKKIIATEPESLQNLQHIIYFSTTGVYGNKDGQWVDEESPLQPNGERQRRRVIAEQEWQALLHYAQNIPNVNFCLDIMRLAGIYGKERNIFRQLQKGKARRIIKENQFFSRIMVDDIANIAVKLMALRSTSPLQSIGISHIFNICDDLPAPSAEIVEYAAKMLDLPPPPAILWQDAQQHLSSMAYSFYQASRKCSNNKIKQYLGTELLYPDYHAGLNYIYNHMQASK